MEEFMPPTTTSTPSNKKNDITPDTKSHIVQFLLNHSEKTIVHHGMIQSAARKFGVSKRTIHRIWAAAKEKINSGEAVIFKSNKLGVCGKKAKLFDKEKILAIPFGKRTSILTLAKELGVSNGTVGNWVKNKVLRAHTNAIKPGLTEKNKLQRIHYSLSALRADAEAKVIKFSEMKNVVHIDEKWFYMTRSSERYYMLEEETEPHRTCQSKRFIPKVMFMCAVCRPILDSEGQVVFDGKIGLWPFTKQEPAKRNSKNRPRGTLETKPIDSITKEVTKQCMLNQIIPAIKEKWPTGASKNIVIQQDNAPPHIYNDDPDFRAAATSDGFNIHLMCQPPNSPDTNINDLGWFRAIQSLQIETASYTVDDLVRNVMLSFQELTAKTLNKVFLSLQGCLIKVLKVQGNNNYKLPHMAKGRLIREGTLPIVLEVDEVLVRESIQIVLEEGGREGFTEELKELLSALGY